MPASEGVLQGMSTRVSYRGEVEDFLRRLKPTCCPAFEPKLLDGELVCGACGTRRPVHAGKVVGTPALEDAQVAEDDRTYQQETKHRYQSESYAKDYLREYVSMRNARSLYSRFVAYRERRAVDACLRRTTTKLDLVLDIPAGTGKLAPIHARHGYGVIAADVSADMLTVGLNGGQWDACPNVVGFIQADVTNTEFSDDTFDCVICLRLLHRLPQEIVERALTEARRISKRYVIVSTGVRGPAVASLFRPVRHGGTLTDWNATLEKFGSVVAHEHVAPFVSKEVVSLVDVR